MKFKVYVKNFVLTRFVWSTTIYPHNSNDIMISDKWDLQLHVKHGNLEKENFNSSESIGSKSLPESVKRKYCRVTLYKYQVVSLTVRLESLAWLEDVNSQLRATKENLYNIYYSNLINVYDTYIFDWQHSNIYNSIILDKVTMSKGASKNKIWCLYRVIPCCSFILVKAFYLR